MNICSGCGNNFHSVSAFDSHRTGSYHKKARTCLTEVEMLQKGMIQQKNGSWSHVGPKDGIVAWEKEVES